MQFTAMIAPVGLKQKPDWSDTKKVAEYLDSFYTTDLDISDLADHISVGNSFSNVFSGRAGRRDGFVLGSIIAIDLDGGPLASYPALLQHPYVQVYATLVYPTMSHTPEAPRHRVVFVLDEPIYGEEGYTYAAQTLTELFPGADKQCAYAGRTFLGNGNKWKDAYYSSRSLPIQHLRVLARQRKAREMARWHNQRHEAPSSEPPELSELFRKISPIDPYAFSYEEWVKMGAALAHTYGDAAFLLFKEWSDRADKPPLTWAKWTSFTKEHPRPASIGSIIFLLEERGK